MTRFKDFKWQLGALALLMFGLMMAKGGVIALRPLLRFALPAGIVYFVYREAKRRLLAAFGDKLRSQVQAAMHRGGQPNPQDPRRGPGGPTDGFSGAGGPVIDLCPKCGVYMTAKHRCAK